jgi:type II secretory pathway component PulF
MTAMTAMMSTILHAFRNLWRALPGRWANRGESAAVVRLLAACDASGTPPGPMLRAWAEDSRGRQGRRLAQAVKCLDLGSSPASAIAGVRGLIHKNHAVALRFAETSGLVGPVVGAVLANETAADAVAYRRARNTVILLGLMMVYWLGYAASIATHFHTIITDFNMPTPFALQGWLGGPLSLCRWLLVLVGVAAFFSARCRRWLAAPFTSPRRQAGELDALAVAVEAGRSPDEAAGMLAASRNTGKSKWFYGQGSPQGSFGEKLAALGLASRAESGMLDRPDVEIPPQLRRLSERRRMIARRRVTAFQAVLVPLGVVIMGSLTFVIATSVFGPLTTLTQQLSEVTP